MRILVGCPCAGADLVRETCGKAPAYQRGWALPMYPG